MCVKVFLLSCILSMPVVLTITLLRIIHNNDIHARISQTSQHSELARDCSEIQAQKNLCYGGLPRMITVVKRERRIADTDSVPTIFLNAGGSTRGTVWYSLYKWKIVSVFMNLLHLDAMCVGIDEFDDSTKTMADYFNSLNMPVLGCNLDLSEEPELSAIIKPSIVISRGDLKIGVIGYITPETLELTATGKVKFNDEIESVKEEVIKLQTQGVNIIIGLSHSGFEKDKEVAAAVTGLDVIVGGRSQTFLYAGIPPDIEKPVDSYPTWVAQGRKKELIVPVVQAFAYSKYLGKLDVYFSDVWEVTKATGNPILLNSKFKQDRKALGVLKAYETGEEQIAVNIIGETRVPLNGTCKFNECNLGNLITDAFVNYGMKTLENKNWSGVAIAIYPSSSIRDSIPSSLNGSITTLDIKTAMPYNNAVRVYKLKGRHIYESLEWSVWNYKRGRGEFLQVSGLHIVYDLEEPPGSRVMRVTARCAHCEVPAYFPLKLEELYAIAIPSIIADTGHNYHMIQKHKILIAEFEARASDIVAEYIMRRKFLYIGIEDRIIINFSPATFIIEPMYFILCVIIQIWY